MKTAVEYIVEELSIRFDIVSNNLPYIQDVVEKAKEMEQNGYQNLINTFIKNRDETRPLIFENGFVKGFEEGAKHSEDFWNKLQETELDEEDFTREYLQEKCNQYLKSDGKNI